jgi:hypothetical protein
VRSLNILFIRHSSRADARGWLHLARVREPGLVLSMSLLLLSKKKWRSSSASCWKWEGEGSSWASFVGHRPHAPVRRHHLHRLAQDGLFCVWHKRMFNKKLAESRSCWSSLAQIPTQFVQGLPVVSWQVLLTKQSFHINFPHPQLMFVLARNMNSTNSMRIIWSRSFPIVLPLSR